MTPWLSTIRELAIVTSAPTTVIPPVSVDPPCTLFVKVLLTTWVSTLTISRPRRSLSSTVTPSSTTGSVALEYNTATADPPNESLVFPVTVLSVNVRPLLNDRRVTADPSADA